MSPISYGHGMNRNHLALFHAVAEAGSVTRAAERLHVSQPAVSKQILELEDVLGVCLLERLPRGVRLTDAGRLLADYARRQNVVEREAERAIEEFRGLKRGRLAVGASTTIAAYLLPPVFGQFHQRCPNIELRLEIANTRDIQRNLMDGRRKYECVAYLPLQKWLAETACLPGSQRSNYSPAMPGRKPTLKAFIWSPTNCGKD